MPPRPTPAPEILDDGNLRCRGPLCPGIQGLGRGAGASASLAQPGAPLQGPGPHPAPSSCGADPTASELGWRVG